MKRTLRLLFTASIVYVSSSSLALAEGNAVRGQQLFNRCGACHSIAGQNRAGPPLNGVLGRKAGGVEGFRYSAAIMGSNLIWTDDTLDSYLSAPLKMLKGTRMTTSVARPDDRADIIAYLRTFATP